MMRRSDKEKAEKPMPEEKMKRRSGEVKEAEKVDNSVPRTPTRRRSGKEKVESEGSSSSSVPRTPTTRRSGKEKVESEGSSSSSVLRTPTRRSGKEKVESEGSSSSSPTRRSGEEKAESMLEAMPQDILIRILCGVDHDDLKQLFHVSKTIRAATLIAKKSHFAYSTPSNVLPFQTPDAPKQSRRLWGRKLSGSGKELFPSDERALNRETRAV